MLNHISLIIKHRAEEPRKAGETLSRYLKQKGVSVTEGEINPGSDAVVVLGGDGTLLHVASAAYSLKIPLLGINLGGLGFLTEIHLDEMEDAIDSLIAGDVDLDRRMMLSVSVVRDAGSNSTFYALNEAVVTKGPLATIIALNTRVDGDPLTEYRGDGLIIATPTGSTAYSLSAGGPILHPSLEAMIITPICPFALSSRPLILHEKMNVEITSADPVEELILIIDGQVSRNLRQGDRVLIKKADGHLDLIKSPLRDYFTILREKLGWTKGMEI